MPTVVLEILQKHIMCATRLQILIEDCVKVLHESIKSGKLYDYVINDLTEFPVEKAVKGRC